MAMYGWTSPRLPGARMVTLTAGSDAVELVGGALLVADVTASKGAASVRADLDLSEARVALAGAVEKEGAEALSKVRARAAARCTEPRAIGSS